MKVYSVFILAFCTISMEVSSDDTSMLVQPSKCVTLKEGKTCYQDVIISWEAKVKGQYCLFYENKSVPFKCWNDVNRSVYEYEFSGKVSTDMNLIFMPTNEKVASQHFSVKWVYKKRPSLGWRLF